MSTRFPALRLVINVPIGLAIVLPARRTWLARDRGRRLGFVR